MLTDLAETENLQKLVAHIGGGLDQFLKFEHPDALHPEAHWREYLDVPLPQQGVGIDQVVADLIEQVIPNGSPIAKPGFTSFITTGATSASVLACQAFWMNASVICMTDLNWRTPSSWTRTSGWARRWGSRPPARSALRA